MTFTAKLVTAFSLALSVISLGYALYVVQSTNYPSSYPQVLNQEPDRPLLEYSFEQLKLRPPKPSPITLEGVITKEASFSAYLFTFTTQDKTVSGQVNLPVNYLNSKLPAVIMLRGFVDPAIYQTGIGTRNAATAFANDGYITIAPDFLGFGSSDPEPTDSFAARLEKPVTVIDLIASVKELPYVDTNNIYIWGHSNGGQIALSVLEITGDPYPTTLWAPVTKPFPYSILYYTDEYDDYGKALRQGLASFEKLYDVQDFSVTTYLDQITAPLQIHQGGIDDAVPLDWSDDFVAQLETINQTRPDEDQIEVNYFTYPNADHNLQPNWSAAVARDLNFFLNHTYSSETN